MPKIIKNLLIFVAAFIIIIVLFNYNILVGLAAVVAGILFVAYISRARILVLQGTAQYSKGDMDKALFYFKKAFDTGKCKPTSSISYGYLLLRAGRIEESEKILNTLLSGNLKSDEKMTAKSNLALVMWKKGNIDEAISILEEVISNYKNTNVYGSLGYMYILKGDLDKALEFNLEAYEYNSSNNVILDNMGQTYYLMGEQDKAEEIYEKLMANKPTVPGVYYNFGLVLAEKGQTEKALEYTKKALDYKINFLSGVTEAEIRQKIEQLEKGLA